jgi:hypothetical protein
MTVGDKHSTTPEDVAQWMLDELEKTGLLYQWEAILDIQSSFGGDFTYLIESGNFAIDRRVLFRKECRRSLLRAVSATSC